MTDLVKEEKVREAALEVAEQKLSAQSADTAAAQVCRPSPADAACPWQLRTGPWLGNDGTQGARTTAYTVCRTDSPIRELAEPVYLEEKRLDRQIPRKDATPSGCTWGAAKSARRPVSSAMHSLKPGGSVWCCAGSAGGAAGSGQAASGGGGRSARAAGRGTGGAGGRPRDGDGVAHGGPLGAGAACRCAEAGAFVRSAGPGACPVAGGFSPN